VLLPGRSPSASFLSHAHGDKDIEQALDGIGAGLKKMEKESQR
jgi:hypothetical protein